MSGCSFNKTGCSITFDSINKLNTNRWEARLRLTFSDGFPQHTKEIAGFADRLLDQLPQMRTHRCDNGTARSFEMELRDTEIAHVFEHVCIELLAQQHPCEQRTSFQGKTGYDFLKDGDGVYRVAIRGFFSEEEVEIIVDGAYKIIMQSLSIV